ncbi:Phosphatidylinositol n-acetylglucosaminyltransferase subunit c, partial [Globisporangium splendens]
MSLRAANVKEHDYWGMVRSSAAITQQICAVLIFFSVFEFIRQDVISFAFLMGVNAVLAIVGYTILRFRFRIPLRGGDGCAEFEPLVLRDAVHFVARAAHTDEIVRERHDLGARIVSRASAGASTSQNAFSGTISLNAAIFTAVLLGSRLQSNEHVFAFILLAIEIFAVFPIFQREVKVRSPYAQSTTHTAWALWHLTNVRIYVHIRKYVHVAQFGACAFGDGRGVLRALGVPDVANFAAALRVEQRVRRVPVVRLSALVHARPGIQKVVA